MNLEAGASRLVLPELSNTLPMKKVGDQNRPKHQHWVPQFYLRYFATPETQGTQRPQVWIFSKNDADGDEKLTSVRNVCGRRYLYSPACGAGDRDWALDDLLNNLESSLSALWPMLAESEVALDDCHVRRAVALFLAVTYLRHPDIRAQVEIIHSNIVETFDRFPKKENGAPEIESIDINGRKYEISTEDWHQYRTWGQAEHDRFFADVVRSEATRIAEALLSKRWSVVIAEKETFITTDKPVCLQHPTQAKFGIETPGVMITFPLSPRRVLVMDDLHHEPANQYYQLSTGSGAAFNAVLWHGASRFLITGRPVSEVLEEMVRLGNSRDSANGSLGEA